MTDLPQDAANDARTTDRATWVAMQRDEADALQRQQDSAGPTHGPVDGPGPYGDHGVNMAVERAIAGERQRCVDIVLAWADQCDRTHRPVEAALTRSLAQSLAIPPGGERGDTDRT